MEEEDDISNVEMFFSPLLVLLFLLVAIIIYLTLKISQIFNMILIYLRGLTCEQRRRYTKKDK